MTAIEIEILKKDISENPVFSSWSQKITVDNYFRYTEKLNILNGVAKILQFIDENISYVDQAEMI